MTARVLRLVAPDGTVLRERDIGRTLATVRVNGRDAGEFLLRRGLAREWRK